MSKNNSHVRIIFLFKKVKDVIIETKSEKLYIKN